MEQFGAAGRQRIRRARSLLECRPVPGGPVCARPLPASPRWRSPSRPGAPVCPPPPPPPAALATALSRATAPAARAADQVEVLAVTASSTDGMLMDAVDGDASTAWQNKHPGEREAWLAVRFEEPV